MNSLKENGLSIGDFAEQLVLSEMKTPQKAKQFISKTPEVEKQKDISEVVVPDEFMSQVLGKKVVSKPQPQKQLIKENIQPKQQIITEEKADKLMTLLDKVITLLEMTTTGSCGCNMAGPAVAEPSGPKKKNKDVVLLFAQKLKRIKK
jgi:hypothetical protein